MSSSSSSRPNDIRGVYPDELDVDIAPWVGNASVAFTKAADVLVGRDMRPFLRAAGRRDPLSRQVPHLPFSPTYHPLA
jgi:hypothetical protein